MLYQASLLKKDLLLTTIEYRLVTRINIGFYGAGRYETCIKRRSYNKKLRMKYYNYEKIGYILWLRGKIS